MIIATPVHTPPVAIAAICNAGYTMTNGYCAPTIVTSNAICTVDYVMQGNVCVPRLTVTHRPTRLAKWEALRAFRA